MKIIRGILEFLNSKKIEGSEYARGLKNDEIDYIIEAFKLEEQKTRELYLENQKLKEIKFPYAKRVKDLTLEEARELWQDCMVADYYNFAIVHYAMGEHRINLDDYVNITAIEKKEE